VDNTQVVAEKHADIDVLARFHEFDEQIADPVRAGQLSTSKGQAETWGDAVRLRIGKQSGSYRSRYPRGSPWTGWNGN